MDSPLVSVILPVYNRKQYLFQAISSVLEQSYDNWELIISDDFSNEETADFLERYSLFPRIHLYRNSKNIGLFPNLNQALSYSRGDYLTILCSDDYLMPEGLKTSLLEMQRYPKASLLLPFTESVDKNNKSLVNAKEYYNNYFAKETTSFSPEHSVPLLLRFGSINGNITGMFFKRKLINELGGFRSDWKHAADWEWIYRVARCEPIIVSRQVTAVIRGHKDQLSVENGKNLSSSIESAQVIRMLLSDPLIKGNCLSGYRARHIMHFHLWYALRLALKGHWKKALKIAQVIEETTGLVQTTWTMLKLFPKRWKARTQGLPFPPPR